MSKTAQETKEIYATYKQEDKGSLTHIINQYQD